MRYLFFILFAFIAGSISNFAQSPWNNIVVLLISFPILFLIFQDISSKKEYKNKTLFFILFGNIFLFGYFFFGLLWIGSAFDYREGFGNLKFISTLGLPALLCLITTPGWIITSFFWGNRIQSCFALSLGIVFGEYVRSYLFTGFPWNLFGHALGFNDYAMQIGSIFGFNFAGIFILLFSLTPVIILKKETLKWGIIFSLIIPFSLIYGYLRIPSEIKFLDKDFIIIQPNISQDKKLNPDETENLIKKFLDLSKIDLNVDLIIWPENAIPVFLSSSEEIRSLIMKELSNTKNLLTGDLILKNNNEISNSAILINSDGKISSSYDKIHLVPFGEYLPFNEHIKKYEFIRILTNERGLSKGKSYDPISTPLGLARILICYEIIFSNEVLRSKYEPDIIINISNDAWFNNYTGPNQHFSNAKFRSVETGLPVLRSSNTGISGVIDPYGRVVEKLSMGEEGFIYSRQPEKLPKTIFVIFGNYIILALLLLCILCYRKNYKKGIL
ncbi:MAG: apolipoprotein N-acyltransferase [Rhizobiales bacterium TMED168]|nr:MAG: apolipoprotein N-acyltransferase [Rhizobiales bacterium TMED168]|tara:strand:+ start:54910 stop:56409 length:1500 start_codon:yes stop_codon:yes gene_type:complete